MVRLKVILLLSLSLLLTIECFSQVYIRKGQYVYNEIVYNFNNKTKYIRKGPSNFDNILYVIDGNFIRKGSTKYGKIVYYIEVKRRKLWA